MSSNSNNSNNSSNSSNTVKPTDLYNGDLITVTGYFADFDSYYGERMTLRKPKDVVVLRKRVAVGDKVICYENEEALAADKDGQVGTVCNTDGLSIHVVLLLLAEQYKTYSCYAVQRATVEQVAAAEMMLAEKKQHEKEKAANAAADALGDDTQRIALVKRLLASMSNSSALVLPF